MITVTTATGRYATLVIEALLRRGVPASNIIAAASNPEHARHWSARGIEVRRADYDQPATLKSAFRDAEKILLVPTTSIGERYPQMKRAIEAAKQAGVKLLAYAGFVNSDKSTLRLGDEHKQTEAEIRASGLPFVFLRNGAYIEVHAGDLGDLGQVLESGVLLGSEGEGKISGASRADLAEAAAVVLTSRDQAGRIYELGGTPFTKAELAAVISELTDKKVVFRSMPVDGYAAILVSAGLPPQLAEIVADTSLAVTRGDWFTESKDLERLIGRASTPLKEVVAQTLARNGIPVKKAA